jgi:peroxiredoxin
MSQLNLRRLWALCGGLLLTGCGQPGPTPAAAPYESYGDYGYGNAEIKFLEAAPSNATTDVSLFDLSLTDLDGQTKPVRALAGEHGAVVVVTRGNTNPICPYCSTQTAHYIRDYAEFQRRGVEVVVVYPIEGQADPMKLNGFLTNARQRVGDPQRPVPFPVLFDVALSVVDQLGIRLDLSKPATYIVDAEGQVQYAYVGAHWGDRPAVSAVLAELDRRGLGAKPKDSTTTIPTSTEAPSAAN